MRLKVPPRKSGGGAFFIGEGSSSDRVVLEYDQEISSGGMGSGQS